MTENTLPTIAIRLGPGSSWRSLAPEHVANGAGNCAARLARSFAIPRSFAEQFALDTRCALRVSEPCACSGDVLSTEESLCAVNRYVIVAGIICKPSVVDLPLVYVEVSSYFLFLSSDFGDWTLIPLFFLSDRDGTPGPFWRVK